MKRFTAVLLAAVSMCVLTPLASAEAEPLELPQVHLVASIAPQMHAAAVSAPLAQVAPDPIDVNVDGVLKTVPQPPAGSPLAIVLAVLTIALPIAVNAYRGFRKDKADAELNAVHAVARTTFFATEEAKRLYPDKVPDTLRYAEAKFIEIYSAQMKQAPSEAQITLAKAQFSALHGESKVREELAEKIAITPSPA